MKDNKQSNHTQHQNERHSSKTKRKKSITNAVIIAVALLVAVAIFIIINITKNQTPKTNNQKNNQLSNRVAKPSTSTTLPKNFPADVPIYQGAKIIAANSNGNAFTISLTSTDNTETIREYYKSQLVNDGWVDSGEKGNFGSGLGSSFKYTKDNRNMMLIITSPSSTQKVTGISMIVSEKPINSTKTN